MNMQGKQVVLAVGALAVLSVSFAAEAGNSTSKNDNSMDVCIEAFVSEQLPQNHPLKIVKRDSAIRDTPSRWNPPQRSTIEISAKGARTGEDFGSATCVLDRKGELVAMEIKGDRVRMAQGDAKLLEPQS
jgi:hypothetical protein